MCLEELIDVIVVTNGLSRPPCLSIPRLREDAVEAYCEWHCSKVRRLDQKQQYELARDLTLERGFDLELIHEDNGQKLFDEILEYPSVS